MTKIDTMCVPFCAFFFNSSPPEPKLRLVTFCAINPPSWPNYHYFGHFLRCFFNQSSILIKTKLTQFLSRFALFFFNPYPSFDLKMLGRGIRKNEIKEISYLGPIFFAWGIKCTTQRLCTMSRRGVTVCCLFISYLQGRKNAKDSLGSILRVQGHGEHLRIHLKLDVNRSTIDMSKGTICPQAISTQETLSYDNSSL